MLLNAALVKLGTGLFKPNISPLVAEQYRKQKLFIRTLESGERVIVDPVYTVSRVYMVHLFFFLSFSYQYFFPSVLLLVHKHRCIGRSNFHDLC